MSDPPPAESAPDRPASSDDDEYQVVGEGAVPVPTPAAAVPPPSAAGSEMSGFDALMSLASVAETDAVVDRPLKRALSPGNAAQISKKAKIDAAMFTPMDLPTTNCSRHVSIATYIYYKQRAAAEAAANGAIPDPTLEARRLKERTEWLKSRRGPEAAAAAARPASTPQFAAAGFPAYNPALLNPAMFAQNPYAQMAMMQQAMQQQQPMTPETMNALMQQQRQFAAQMSMFNPPPNATAGFAPPASTATVKSEDQKPQGLPPAPQHQQMPQHAAPMMTPGMFNPQMMMMNPQMQQAMYMMQAGMLGGQGFPMFNMGQPASATPVPANRPAQPPQSAQQHPKAPSPPNDPTFQESEALKQMAEMAQANPATEKASSGAPPSLESDSK